MIKITNLTFSYDSYGNNIFEDVNFNIDTNWRLGFIGRNGKGKTTFLNLLLGKYEYRGTITSSVTFDYFPFEVENSNLNSYEIAASLITVFENWQLDKEISQLNIDSSILEREFRTLSRGEQTKVMLAILFIKNNNFLLIDEPTNHLDEEGRNILADYLKTKSGFILVSHDRNFLDRCVNHILSINRNNIVLEKGNFSSWYANKEKQDNFEINQNYKLKKDINRLEKAAAQAANWSDKIEASKYNIRKDILQDKGYIGHKSAKMMQRAINIQNRKEKEITEKSKLLKNIETIPKLKLNMMTNRSGRLIEINNLTIFYDDKLVLKDINFYLEDGDRICLKGKNGSGKSSILKLIMGENISYIGNLYKQSDLKISYICQDTSFLKGNLKDFIKSNNLDETLFKTILRKFDFDRNIFTNNLETYSDGQKKKVLIAKSLSEKANIYIWDEPLNYIDIYTRMQIENLILEYQPTLIFVEHDSAFTSKIMTKEIVL